MLPVQNQSPVKDLTAPGAPTGQAQDKDLKTWLNRVLRGLPATKIDTNQQSFEEQELYTLKMIRKNLETLTADFLKTELGLKATTTRTTVLKALALLGEEK